MGCDQECRRRALSLLRKHFGHRLGEVALEVVGQAKTSVGSSLPVTATLGPTNRIIVDLIG
jgi:hypothetical protein